jgi:hypothetical protein
VTAAPAPPAGAATVRGGRPASAELLLLLAVLVASALLLHVPRPRVPLVYDMVGYAAQAHALLAGHGNTIAMGEEHLPGIYPVGVPALAALAMALLGPDLRNGLWAVLACALLVLPCVHACVRRAGLPALAGATAALFVLSSPLFRTTSGYLMSQVPTALAVALVLRLFLARASAAALFGAGLLAMLSLLLRYANISFPVALAGAELLCGGARGRPRAWSLGWLGAGLVAGALVVLAHNALLYGGPLTTGYGLWGWNVEGQFGWRHVLGSSALSAPSAPSVHGEWILGSALLGLSELQSVPMVAAALLGLLFCWRDGRGSASRAAVPQARLLGGLAACTIGASFALLAGYSFRSESYLVPTVPAFAALAGYGLWRALETAAGPRAARLSPVLAAGLLAVSVLREPPPKGDITQSVERFASLERAGRELPPDAALITTADPGLVEPLFRRPARDVLYLGPFVSPLVEERALRELGADSQQPRHVVAWALERLRAGRAVYLDQNPPPRGLLSAHVAVRTALRASFALAPTDVASIFRLSRIDARRDAPGRTEDAAKGGVTEPRHAAAPATGGEAPRR